MTDHASTYTGQHDHRQVCGEWTFSSGCTLPTSVWLGQQGLEERVWVGSGARRGRTRVVAVPKVCPEASLASALNREQRLRHRLKHISYIVEWLTAELTVMRCALDIPTPLWDAATQLWVIMGL